MSCIIHHLNHPLTSRSAEGEKRYMNVEDGSRLVRFVLGFIIISASAAFYQTRSYAFTYVIAVTTGCVMFYLITAVMKFMKRYDATEK